MKKKFMKNQRRIIMSRSVKIKEKERDILSITFKKDKNIRKFS